MTGGYRGLHRVMGGDKGLQGMTRDYKGMTRGYRGLQGVTRGDKGLQGMTSG